MVKIRQDAKAEKAAEIAEMDDEGKLRQMRGRSNGTITRSDKPDIKAKHEGYVEAIDDRLSAIQEKKQSESAR